MDKKIKSIIRSTKGLESKEKKLLKEDIKHDRVIDRAKKVLKKKGK